MKRYPPIWNQRILDLRATTDLNDKEWCEAIGIKQQNMKGYQDGTRSFTVKQIIIAAKMYNTSVDYLVGLTNQKTKNVAKLSAIEMIEEGLNMLKTEGKQSKNALPKTLPKITKVYM